MINTTVATPSFARNVVRVVLITIAVVIAIMVLARIPRTLEVFLVATLIAYGMNPLIRRLSERIPRLAAIAIVYLIFLLLLLVGAIIIIPTIVDQVTNLFSHSADYLAAAQQWMENVQGWLNRRLGGHALPPQLSNIEGAAMARLSDFLQTGLSGLGTLVFAVINYVIIGITAIILSYYFLVNAKSVRESFLGLFPERSQARAKYFVHEVGRVVGGFIGGQIVLSAFSGVFTYVGLALIGSPYALLLGFLTGVLYAIPYLGVFGAILVGVLLGLLQGWKIAVWTAVIIFVVTKVADTVLVPKVMSESVGVSPMAIIFAVFAGGELFGLWGLVLAIPAAALIKVVWLCWVYPWITGKPAPLLEQTPQVLAAPIDSVKQTAR